MDAVKKSVLRFAGDVRASTLAAVSAGFLRSLSSAARLHPDSRPERHDVEVIPDIAYLPGGDPAHLLDVYRPTNHPRPLPIVIYIHGGGFRLLSKDTHWLMGLVFARFGYLVFNISYRLAPRHRYPAAIADAAAAYAWVVENAARYGGDPSRIVVAGESAGGNLATALSVVSCYRRPEPWAQRVFDTGVVPGVTIPFCAILQVSSPDRFGARRRLPFWLDDILRDVATSYLVPDGGACELADPLCLLERGEPPDRPLPAFFVPVGTRDPLLDDSRRLKRALDALGVPCTAMYYPGEVHAFHALVWRKEARRCWRDSLAFAEQHLRHPRSRSVPDGPDELAAAG
jgi:acetyl esterase